MLFDDCCVVDGTTERFVLGDFRLICDVIDDNIDKDVADVVVVIGVVVFVVVVVVEVTVVVVVVDNPDRLARCCCC